MRYKNFDELDKAYSKGEYGSSNGSVDRNTLSFDEELAYVEDCFDTYEGLGFSDRFHTPYDDLRNKEGMKFVVDRRMSYVKDNIDLEALPKWHITFEDGTHAEAYPEEICLAETFRC